MSKDLLICILCSIAVGTIIGVGMCVAVPLVIGIPFGIALCGFGCWLGYGHTEADDSDMLALSGS